MARGYSDRGSRCTPLVRYNLIGFANIWDNIHDPKKAEYQHKAELKRIFTQMYNQMDTYRSKFDSLNYVYQKMVKEYKESNQNLAVLKSIEKLLKKQAEEIDDEEEDVKADTGREGD
jgi:hypothetical protein